jgi:flotillin
VRKPADTERYRVEQEAQARKNAAIAEAEAATIAAAEAQAMQSRADAFGAYGEAAVLDPLLTVLPQLVSAAAAPVGAIDKLTVISTDGASSLTKSVASTVAQGLQLGTDLTGVDLSQLLARLAQRSSERQAASVPDGRAVTAGTTE